MTLNIQQHGEEGRHLVSDALQKKALLCSQELISPGPLQGNLRKGLLLTPPRCFLVSEDRLSSAFQIDL